MDSTASEEARAINFKSGFISKLIKALPEYPTLKSFRSQIGLHSPGGRYYASALVSHHFAAKMSYFGNFFEAVSFSPGSMSIQPLYPLDGYVGDDEGTQRPFNSSGPALPAKLINRPSEDDIPWLPFPANPGMAYNFRQIHDDLPFPNDMPYASLELGRVCTVHDDKEHTRAFTCVFNFAGCPSTFASKNEWKRHVATQHLNFNTWVCNLDACGKAHAESSSSPKKEMEGMSSKRVIFNRKDLFTQHVRRMHAPNRKRPDKQKSTWDDRIKELQKDCLQVNRQGPKILKCPVADCPALFSGSKCWDDRMEHVAKHLEKVAEIRGAASVQHQNDELLVKWAQNEGIIDRVDGEYKLIPMNPWLEGLDEDAEASCEESCASATPYFPALDLSAVAYSEQTVVTKHENLPNVQTKEMEHTDSGYASALNSNYSSNEQGVVDKAEFTNPDATDTVGDDIRTTYSAATTVIPEIARQFISDVCKDIYNRLEPHVDNKTWESLSSTIPGRIKILALKLGSGSSDEFNRRIMHFVHKHHQ